MLLLLARKWWIKRDSTCLVGVAVNRSMLNLFIQMISRELWRRDESDFGCFWGLIGRKVLNFERVKRGLEVVDEAKIKIFIRKRFNELVSFKFSDNFATPTHKFSLQKMHIEKKFKTTLNSCLLSKLHQILWSSPKLWLACPNFDHYLQTLVHDKMHGKALKKKSRFNEETHTHNLQRECVAKITSSEYETVATWNFPNWNEMLNCDTISDSVMLR